MMTEYIPIGSDFLITIGEGLGAAYGAGKYLFCTDTNAAFALKGDLGFTYFLFSKYGLGIDIEAALYMAVDDGVSMSYMINPMITYTMVF